MRFYSEVAESTIHYLTLTLLPSHAFFFGAGSHAGQWTAQGINTGAFGTNGGPIALFNSSGYTFVLSALTDFTTAAPTWSGELNNVLGVGFNSALDGIPAGYSFKSVLVAGQGITDTMHAWGDVLLAQGNKTRTGPTSDPQTAYLTYWTDNGALKTIELAH